jgi:hypothetical protein
MGDNRVKQPLIIPVSDKYYRLAEKYVYEWEINDCKNRIIIPSGFTYDGASVPRIAWTVSGLRPDGLIRASALVHDWIYRHKGKLPNGSQQYLDDIGIWQDVYGFWTRKDADRLFARIMREAGVYKCKRRMAYRSACMFGRFAWG